MTLNDLLRSEIDARCIGLPRKATGHGFHLIIDESAFTMWFYETEVARDGDFDLMMAAQEGNLSTQHVQEGRLIAEAKSLSVDQALARFTNPADNAAFDDHWFSQPFFGQGEGCSSSLKLSRLRWHLALQYARFTLPVKQP